jgi:hypothetical protein
MVVGSLTKSVMLRELRFREAKWSITGSLRGCGIRGGWLPLPGTSMAMASRTDVCYGECRKRKCVVSDEGIAGGMCC